MIEPWLISHDAENFQVRMAHALRPDLQWHRREADPDAVLSLVRSALSVDSRAIFTLAPGAVHLSGQLAEAIAIAGGPIHRLRELARMIGRDLARETAQAARQRGSNPDAD